MKNMLLKGSIMVLAGIGLICSSYAYDNYQAANMSSEEALELETKASVMPNSVELKMVNMPEELSTEEYLINTTEEVAVHLTNDAPVEEKEDIRPAIELSMEMVAELGHARVANEIEKMLSSKIPFGLEDLDNLAISLVDSLNVREDASYDAAVVGKLTVGEVVTVKEIGAEWTKIVSAHCSGYVSNEYVVFDMSAKFYIAENYTYSAKPTVSSLRVRADKSTESDIVKNVTSSVALEVSAIEDEWIAVKLADGTSGYVASEYVTLGWNFTVPETEEADDNTEVVDESKEDKKDDKKTDDKKDDKKTDDKKEDKKADDKKEDKKTDDKKTDDKKDSDKESKQEVSDAIRAKGQAVVDYAMQFVGNPYKAGGTSLTKGADCSGFTMSVYKHFGYTLDRTSSGQRNNGKKVSMKDIIPGDLICYSGHVGIYIGKGQIVHASTPKGGIKVGSMYYANPICARRIVR